MMITKSGFSVKASDRQNFASCLGEAVVAVKFLSDLETYEFKNKLQPSVDKFPPPVEILLGTLQNTEK